MMDVAMSAMKRIVAGLVSGLMLMSMVTLPAAAQPLQAAMAQFIAPSGVTLTAKKSANPLTLKADYRVDPQYLRQLVRVKTTEKIGTIIVDTSKHFLYYVVDDGQALRYGIGVAKSGFEWSGTHRVTRKAEWPSWTPPAEMRKRQPGLPAFMEGGPNNPLGARALYIGSTLYRIHGTTEPWSIGQNVSSGCIRMTNDDVIDLYQRVTIGATVVVL